MNLPIKYMFWKRKKKRLQTLLSNKIPLPYDAEIEYLESSGKQLIDTGITGGTSCEYSLTFQILTGNVRFAHLCGSSRPSTAPKLYLSGTNGALIAEHNGNQNIVILSPLTNYDKHTIDYKGGSLYLDNTVVSSPGEYGFGDRNFCLYGYYPENLPIKAKIFACKIWRDGSLVRDYIPVRVEQVGYMYDKVSGTLFGNVGTGDFVLGNDIVPIEYLESTGTQYIDTLFYPRTTNPNIKAEVKFNKSVLTGDNCVLGARTTADGSKGYKLPNFYNSTLEIQGIVSANNANNLTGTYSINTDYTFTGEIKNGSQKFYVDNILNKEFTASNNCDPGGNLYLFALNKGGLTTWKFNGKIYYCKIWQDDILVRDFIPVRGGTTGYMLDKVSHNLFANANSDSFILGPDL